MFEISNSSSPRKSDAIIIQFPPRGNYRFDIRVERERGDLSWFVLLPDRSHGWIHGDYDGAFREAKSIARSYGVAVLSSAGRVAP
jgi:hypothetical protein